MERILEILAISFVAVAALWFVSAQAWGIWTGIREARKPRGGIRSSLKRRPF
jgi:hypothetical protein